jgi:hypothetical protein
MTIKAPNEIIRKKIKQLIKVEKTSYMSINQLMIINHMKSNLIHISTAESKFPSHKI